MRVWLRTQLHNRWCLSSVQCHCIKSGPSLVFKKEIALQELRGSLPTVSPQNLPSLWWQPLWLCSELSAAWEGSKHPQMLRVFSVCFKSDRGFLCHMEWLWQWPAAEWWRDLRCTSAGRIHGCPSWVQDTWTYSSVELNHCECFCHAWINWVTDETETSWAGCRSRGLGWG